MQNNTEKVIVKVKGKNYAEILKKSSVDPKNVGGQSKRYRKR